ncbi:MAG: MFS transporter [Candidatus Paceibacterota bacterium]
MYFIDILLNALKRNSAYIPLYSANFFVSFHAFLLIYINSSFLTQFIDEKLVGTIYILGAVLSMLTLLGAGRVLKKIGNYRFFFILVVTEMAALVLLSVADSTQLVIPLFLIYSVTFPLMLFALDIFLEARSKESATGGIRGTFLTIANTTLIFSPLIVGQLVIDDHYAPVYLVAALMLLPLFFIVSGNLRKFRDPVYETFNLIPALKKFRENRNIYRIFMCQFFMRFFFSWMVIYMPIYLHEFMGFSWSEISIMFTIMLLPFVLLEWPLGKIADKWTGEKEILSIGFVIIAGGTMLIPFLTEPDIVLWTLLLVIMRIGAAAVEIMTETYFFKHVDGDDASLISFFRVSRPLAYVFGPIVATVALTFVSLQNIFFILAFIVLFALQHSVMLKDTK